MLRMPNKYAKNFKALLIYLPRRRQMPQFYFGNLQKKLQNKGKTEELET